MREPVSFRTRRHRRRALVSCWPTLREGGWHRFPCMTPTIEEIRRKVAEPMSRRGVVRVSIFGSVARGEATAGSDVDFLVEFEKGRTLVDLSGLRLDLCEILGRDVDVATPGSLHPKLRDRILRELVPVL